MKSKFNLKLQFADAGLIAALTVAGVAVAQTLPKEGRFDTSNCWSGVANPIAFSKTHSAFTYEFTGTTRSNLAGGAFDTSAFRCIGMTTVIEGKTKFNVVCETVDRDGDKWLSQYLGEGLQYSGTALVGTGKYEGMVLTSDRTPNARFANNKNQRAFRTAREDDR